MGLKECDMTYFDYTAIRKKQYTELKGIFFLKEIGGYIDKGRKQKTLENSNENLKSREDNTYMKRNIQKMMTVS